jgi:hypothetical protein
LEVGYVKDRERVVQRTFRFTFGREKMDTQTPKAKCLELAKKELGPGAGLFATVALAGKLYRASFPKPMWTETEEPKSKAVAVTATREYAGEGGVRQYGPEGGWVTAAGL